MSGGIVSPPALLGLKNLLINSDFRYSQRYGASKALASAGQYVFDRWISGYGTGGTPAATVVRGAFTPGNPDNPPGEPRTFIYHNQTAQATSTSPMLQQRIEDVRTGAGRTITISGWVTASKSLTLSLWVAQYFGTGGTPSAAVSTPVGAWSITTTWQRFQATIAIPSINGKTLGTDENHSLIIYFYMPLSDTYVTYFTNMQVEYGTVATDYEIRHPEVELALCQRYYEKSYDLESPVGTATPNGESYIVIGGGLTTASFGLTVPFRTTKRSNPVVTVYSPANGVANAIYDYAAATNRAVTTVDWEGCNGFRWYCATYGGTGTFNTGCQWVADAEI